MSVQKKMLAVFMAISLLAAGCNTGKRVEKNDPKDPEETNMVSTRPVRSKETNANVDGNYIVLKINYIGCIYFTGEAPWKSDVKYTVITELGDEYKVGDYVQVLYDDIYQVEENEYEVYVKEVSAPNAVSGKCSSTDYKPVIYLYPTKKEHVSVKLDYKGTITVSSPEYTNHGWEVEASPDGTITGADKRAYPYIFWEGIREMAFDITQGFCVKGSETESFLKDKLTYMGLNEKESKAFIDFWMPYMKGNTYNLISFQGSAYTDFAKLSITPKPDSILRVYMVFKPLKEKLNIKEQQLSTFERHGFTVVEWGGTIQ